jgi:hypothetical protein
MQEVRKELLSACKRVLPDDYEPPEVCVRDDEEINHVKLEEYLDSIIDVAENITVPDVSAIDTSDLNAARKRYSDLLVDHRALQRELQRLQESIHNMEDKQKLYHDNQQLERMLETVNKSTYYSIVRVWKELKNKGYLPQGPPPNVDDASELGDRLTAAVARMEKIEPEVYSSSDSVDSDSSTDEGRTQEERAQREYRRIVRNTRRKPRRVPRIAPEEDPSVDSSDDEHSQHPVEYTAPEQYAVHDASSSEEEAPTAKPHRQYDEHTAAPSESNVDDKHVEPKDLLEKDEDSYWDNDTKEMLHVELEKALHTINSINAAHMRSMALIQKNLQTMNEARLTALATAEMYLLQLNTINREMWDVWQKELADQEEPPVMSVYVLVERLLAKNRP